MRRAARVDANHAEIAAAFEKMGCSFLSLAALGRGAPDAAIGYGGLTMLIEIKNPQQPKSKRKLRPAQVKFWDSWRGAVRLVDGIDAAIETANVMKLWRAKLSQ